MNDIVSPTAPALAPDPDLAFTLARRLGGATRRVEIGRETGGETGRETGRETGNGLAKLVLALVNVIHELLERQAMRRIEGGSLTRVQVEALGEALMRQALTILELCDQLGITEEDLAIDLGPLGRLAGDAA